MQAEYLSADEDDDVVQPHFAWDDLSQTWIGLGAALDWIIMRGQPLPLHVYQRLEDEAAVALVAALADMEPTRAELMVRGAVDGVGPLVSVAAGIWAQTATSEAEDGKKPYRLITVDKDEEWAGALHGKEEYRFLQIRAAFIRKTWPQNDAQIDARGTAAVSRAKVERQVKSILAKAPATLLPLTQREVCGLVQRLCPGTPRDRVRDIFKEQDQVRKPGPRGPRFPERPALIAKLGDELIAAQLPN